MKVIGADRLRNIPDYRQFIFVSRCRVCNRFRDDKKKFHETSERTNFCYEKCSEITSTNFLEVPAKSAKLNQFADAVSLIHQSHQILSHEFPHKINRGDVISDLPHSKIAFE